MLLLIIKEDVSAERLENRSFLSHAYKVSFISRCSPSSQSKYYPCVRGRISCSNDGYPNSTYSLIVHVDMTQQRELLQKITERSACHWLVSILSLMFYERW